MPTFTATINGVRFNAPTKSNLVKKIRTAGYNFRPAKLEKIIKKTVTPLYLEEKDTNDIFKVTNRTSIPLLKREFNMTDKQAKQIKTGIRLNKPVNTAGDYKLVSKIARDESPTFSLIVHLDIPLWIDSVGTIWREKTFIFNDPDNFDPEIGILTESDLDNEIGAQVRAYVDLIPNAYLSEEVPIEIPNLTRHKVIVKIKSIKTLAKLEFKNMKLREDEFLTIFNESLEMYKPPENVNCVRGYVKEKTKISMKSLLKFGNEEGVSIDEYNKICKRYGIKFKCFDTTGQLISETTPEKKYARKYANMTIMTTNNHIYPIKNKEFAKKSKPVYNKQIVECGDDLKNELLDYLGTGRMPLKIKAKSNAADILYFETVERIYLSNADYLPIKAMCKKMGFAENIPYDISRFSIANFLMPYYTKENITSVWMNSNDFKKTAFNYYNADQLNDTTPLDNKEIYDGDNIITTSTTFVNCYLKDINEKFNEYCGDILTIDKNRCYGYCLTQLPFLISVDYRIHKKITNFDIIVDHYLYIAVPKESTILMPTTATYIGYHIKYCQKYNVEFVIKEGIETKKHDNYLKQLVLDIYKYCDDDQLAKDIVNFMYGKMYKDGGIKDDYYEVLKVCNKDEAQRTEGYEVSLNDEYSLFYKVKSPSPKLCTMKPISLQILDYSKVVMFEKMLELNLRNEDVIKIGTDSISFRKNASSPIKGIGKTVNDWKYETFKPMTKTINVVNVPCPSFSNAVYQPGQITRLVTGNAGNGKTYNIINTLIPSLMTSFIVLTPTHAAIKEYKKNVINSKVIQSYFWSNSIPTEKSVIIDEIGLVTQGDWNTILKCAMAGKDIYAYGDFTQLLPYGSVKQADNKLLIDCIFREKTILKGNHRNDFTEKYYNTLRNSRNKQYLEIQVNKHSTNWKDAEHIICYKNETVEKYNKMKLDHLGYKFGDVGSKILLRSNDLHDKGIYNKFLFTVKDIKNDIYTLDNNTTITKKQLESNFKPGYAMTLYCIQGDSIKSYHYPTEDNQFINSRSAYTLISRLKTDKIIKPKIKKKSNLTITIQ